MFLQTQAGDQKRFREVIIHACLYDERYERQTGESRGFYLDAVIAATSEPNWYAALHQAGLTDETEGSIDQILLDDLIETLGEEAEARQATEQIAAQFPAIAPYLNWLWHDKEPVKQWARKREIPTVSATYEEFQVVLDEAVRANKGAPLRRLEFRRWGQEISDELLKRLAQDIPQARRESGFIISYCGFKGGLFLHSARRMPLGCR